MFSGLIAAIVDVECTTTVHLVTILVVTAISALSAPRSLVKQLTGLQLLYSDPRCVYCVCFVFYEKSSISFLSISIFLYIYIRTVVTFQH